MKINKRVLQQSFDKVFKIVSDKSPIILTGFGITGFVSTAIFAAKAAPKATKAVECEQTFEDTPLTKFEVAKISFKYYAPAIAMAAVSTACIIGGQSINLKRNAALASLYSISESTLKEYQGKLIDAVGEDKAEKIESEINQKTLINNPVDANLVTPAGGDILCYDKISGRYFMSDQETIRAAVNNFNQEVLLDGSATLNDLYFFLHLDNIQLGDMFKWNAEHLLDVRFDAQVATNNQPCLVMACSPLPQFDY